jgi:hypothetical protein
MPIKTRLFTSLLVCVFLVWAAMAAVSVPTVFADDATLYRFTKYRKEGGRIAVWFQESGSSRAKGAPLKLKFPVQLARKQKVVDGVVSQKTCLLAALRGDKVSIIEISAGKSWKEILSIKERQPSHEDEKLFQELAAAHNGTIGEAKGSGLVSTMDASRPECRAQIFTAGNCGPCNDLKTMVASNQEQYGCNAIEWIDCGPDYKFPNSRCRNAGISGFPTIRGKVCSDCNLQRPNRQLPPVNQPPPSVSPCPGRIECGQDHYCCPPNDFCVNPTTKQCGRKPSPGPAPSPPTDPSEPSDDAGCITLPDGTRVCLAPPVASQAPVTPKSCEEKGKQTCSKGDAKWCCERSDSCGTNVDDCRPAAPDLPATPPTAPSGPCSVTYSCRYTDGSTGSGTVTCSPQATSVNGHWGTMDCKTCATSFNPHCGSGTTPPSAPPGNPPPSVGNPVRGGTPVLGGGVAVAPGGPRLCSSGSCGSVVPLPVRSRR